MADSLEAQLENSEDSPLAGPSPKAMAQRRMQPLRAGTSSLVKPSASKASTLRFQALIAERIAIMMAGLRRDDYSNADGFVRIATAIFEQFPIAVIMSVTDEGSGLHTQTAYPPTPAEIMAACKRSERQFHNIERSKARREQATKPKPEPLIDRSNRPTFEEMRAKHGYWLDRKSDRHIPKWVRPLNEIAMECSVSAEQLAALPDEKQRSKAKPLGDVAAAVVSRETSP